MKCPSFLTAFLNLCQRSYSCSLFHSTEQNKKAVGRTVVLRALLLPIGLLQDGIMRTIFWLVCFGLVLILPAGIAVRRRSFEKQDDICYDR
jgi:hypothetical protein